MSALHPKFLCRNFRFLSSHCLDCQSILKILVSSVQFALEIKLPIAFDLSIVAIDLLLTIHMHLLKSFLMYNSFYMHD